MFGSKNTLMTAMAVASQIVPSLAAYANGTALRIMPLGASITHGYLSPDGNGYRLTLYDEITNGGNSVDMVGSNPNGTMSDPDNEGWPGYVVDQVHDVAKDTVPDNKPNLVLINVGTNDCIQDIDLPGASDRMDSLLNDLYNDSPAVTIVLSTLLPTSESDESQARTEDFNAQMFDLVQAHQDAGKPITIVDMQGDNGLTVDDLVDGVHPTEDGYQRMAYIFLDGIADADSRGYLQVAESI